MERSGDKRDGLKLDRRQVLAAVGGTVASVAASSCGVVVSQPHASNPKVTRQIKFPHSDVKVPSTPLTLSWLDSDDLKEPFEQAVFSGYQKYRSNVKISYDGTSGAAINQAVPLGIRNGNPPDVFAMPGKVPVQTAINEGWVSPIDDLIPNFDAWKKAFPPGAFIPGVHVFNNRTYTYPAASAKRYSYMLMYDVDYMKQAGYDPSKERFTWDTFRAAAKKITKQGAGQYYGLMWDNQSLGGVISNLAELAGLHGSSFGSNSDAAAFNWKTGTYNYTQPQLQAAFELMMALKSDGSIFPGFLSLIGADARSRMPQRVAGMIFDGPWDIPKWPQANPGYKFQIAYPPMGNDKKWNPSTYQETGANQVFVAALSKNKEVAGEIFAYIGSLEGQTEMVVLSGGNLESEMPQANTNAKRSHILNAKAQKAVEISDGLMRIGPLPQERNADTANVILEMAAVSPTLNDIAQGVLSGQITNVKSALQDLQNRSEQILEKAITAAQAKGANVSQSDWVFPNWVPGTEYTQQDYAKLK